VTEKKDKGDGPPVMRMTFPVREGMSVSGLKPLKGAMITMDRDFRIKTKNSVVDRGVVLIQVLVRR